MSTFILIKSGGSEVVNFVVEHGNVATFFTVYINSEWNGFALDEVSNIHRILSVYPNFGFIQ